MDGTVLAEVMLSSYLTAANELGSGTAVLSVSGPEVKAIPATTKARRGWMAQTAVPEKSCSVR